MKNWCLYSVLLWFWASPAFSQTLPVENLTPGGKAVVKTIIDGDTLTLDDGRVVRLVGVQAPKLPLGRPQFEAWPLADEAKSHLLGLAQEQTVWLFYDGATKDRHHRILAHVRRDDGLWLQGAMVSRGLARVYSFPDNRQLVEQLYRLEDRAVAERVGVWRHPFYEILQAEESAGRAELIKNKFNVISGEVLSAAKVGKRIYINFGEKWSEDFTVLIENKAARLFDSVWVDDPHLLVGKKIQVRGWTRVKNGPMIEVSHPEQLRIFGTD